MMENIRVCLRMRPMIAKELKESKQPAFLIDHNKIQINQKVLRDLMTTKRGMQAFSYEFNRCYDEIQHNFIIFQQSVKDIILASMQGINGTIFMYGQTGSGKTFTMLGSKKSELATGNQLKQFIQQSLQNREFNDIGILIYSLMEIFKEINKDESRQYELKCSYYEIYNENVYDLLLDQNFFPIPLQVSSKGSNEFYVKNLTQFRITSLEEVMQLIHLGEKNRHYAETILNHQSSRSHTIFNIHLSSYEEKEGQTFNQAQGLQRASESQINFIDLAGSEKISNYNLLQEDYSNTTNEETMNKSIKERVKESQSINTSLFFLTRVIALKTQKVPPSHIPFRNSTLTKLMKGSLTGNFRTLLILCINPSVKQFDQSHSTLKFGLQSRLIENKVFKTIKKQIEQNYTYTIPNQQDSFALISELQGKLKAQDDLIKIQKEQLNLRTDTPKKEKKITTPKSRGSEHSETRESFHREVSKKDTSHHACEEKIKSLESVCEELKQKMKYSNEQILEYYTSHKELEALIDALKQQNKKLQLFAQQALKRIEVYETGRDFNHLSNTELGVMETNLRKQLLRIEEVKKQKQIQSLTPTSMKKNAFYQNSSEENLEEIPTKQIFFENELTENLLFKDNQGSLSSNSLPDSKPPKDETPTKTQKLTPSKKNPAKKQPKKIFHKASMRDTSPFSSGSKMLVQKFTSQKLRKNQLYSSKPAIKSKASQKIPEKEKRIIHNQSSVGDQDSFVDDISVGLLSDGSQKRSKSQDNKPKVVRGNLIEKEKQLLKQDIQSLADKLYSLAEKCKFAPSQQTPKSDSLLRQMNKDQIIFETESELCMESRDSITIEEQKKGVKPYSLV